MKRFMCILPVALAALVSFSAFSAKEISREQAKEMNLTKLGTVTTQSQSAPMDAQTRLSEKADKMGGKYYVIIAASEKDKMHATAEVYADKQP